METCNVVVNEANVGTNIPEDVIQNNIATVNDEDEVINTSVTEKRRMVNVTDEETDATQQRLMHIPEDLEEIMPQADQVWNCDEIGLDSNGT